jgi:hypothetical protein
MQSLFIRDFFIFPPIKLLSINEDGFVSMMDLESCETKDDLRLPVTFPLFILSILKFQEGEVGDQIKQAFEKDENGILVTTYFLTLNNNIFSLSIGDCCFRLWRRGHPWLEEPTKPRLNKDEY